MPPAGRGGGWMTTCGGEHVVGDGGEFFFLREFFFFWESFLSLPRIFTNTFFIVLDHVGGGGASRAGLPGRSRSVVDQLKCLLTNS